MATQSPLSKSPGALGYRMPAEWEPHAATWLAYPHFREDWPGKFAPILWVFAEIVRNLARHERVEIFVNDQKSEGKARKLFDRAGAMAANVHFHRWPTDRIWLRDSGPIFVKSIRNTSALKPSLLATAWRFNGWAKYPNYADDAKVAERLARKAGIQSVHPMFGSGALSSPAPRTRNKPQRVVLEGGSIDTNGLGTLLTTEECLLSEVQQRNPGMMRTDYERVFAEYLGINNVIWLGNGIAGDDTHGHVDDLARFVSASTVVTAMEPNRNDVNHAPLAENLSRLKAATDQDGKRLKVIELPMPKPVIFAGRRLPASYANFYIANGIVLVPVFNDVSDRVALNILADVFPMREVVPIYSGDFIWGFGAMHCMTQQQPAG